MVPPTVIPLFVLPNLALTKAKIVKNTQIGLALRFVVCLRPSGTISGTLVD